MRYIVLPLLPLLSDVLVGAQSATLSPSGAAISEVACNFESGLCQFVSDASADFDWIRHTGRSPTFDTGPSKDHTTGSGYYVYLESSSQVPNDRCRLLTPLLESGSYNVGFWYSAWGADVGTLALLAREESSGYESLVWYYKPEVNGSEVDNSWIAVSLDNVNLVKKSYLVWEGIRGDGNYGDIGLDDISVARTGDAQLASGPQENTETLPYVCTFESSCGTTDYWESTESFSWTIGAGPGSSPNTGPSVDHTFRNASGHYMMIDVGNTPRFEVAVLSTPAFNSMCGCINLTFWWHGYGTQLGLLTVTQEGFEQSLWTTANENSLNRWRQTNLTLWPATTRPFKILFYGEAGPGPLGDFAIDDISVQDCSVCFLTTTQTTWELTHASTDGSITWTPDPKQGISTDETTFDQMQSQTSTTPDPPNTQQVTTAQITVETTVASSEPVTSFGVTTILPTTTPTATTTEATTTTTIPSTTATSSTWPPTATPITTTETATESITRMPLTTAMPTTVLSTMIPTIAATVETTTTITTTPSMTDTSSAIPPKTTLTTTTATTTTLPSTTVVSSTLLPTTTPITETMAETTTTMMTTPPIMTTSSTIPPTTTLTTTTTLPSTTVVSSTVLPTSIPITATMAETTTTMKTTPSMMTTSATIPPMTVAATEATTTTTTEMPSTTTTSSTALLIWTTGHWLLNSTTYSTTSMPSTNTTSMNALGLTTTTTPTPTITSKPQPVTTPSITSTPGPSGQFFCDFESDACQFQSSSNRLASWNLAKVADVKQPGYPVTDHTFQDAGLGTYMATFINDESSGVAILTSREVYNPGGCNRLEFWIHADGTDVGSLIVSLMDSSTGTTGYLWVTSGQNISAWTKVVTLFQAIGPFKLAFTAKGSLSPWTLFALDDIRLSTVACSMVVGVPTTGGATSTVVNNTVYMTGSYGIVQSANFPNPYPDSYSQTWIITVASGNIVGLMLTILDTEACCDMLKVFDPYAAVRATLLLSASGTLNGEPQTYYSSRATVIVSFSSDADISLTGFRLQWWAIRQTTIAPSSTTAPSTPSIASFGQFFCNFDTDWCSFYTDTTLDYVWMRTSRSSANSPTGGPAPADHTTGLGSYIYVNTQSTASSNLARMLSPVAFSADGCSVLTFYYYAAGPALGSLTVRMLAATGGSNGSAAAASSVVLWSKSGAATTIGSWTQAVATFKFAGTFRLAFEAKRVNSSAGGYAIDDVAVSTCKGLLDPVMPTGSTATATDDGNITLLTGSYGTIQSPNYPFDYPSSYRHTWKITVPASQRVAVFVNDFLTEACCDVAQLIDGGTGQPLQMLRGAVSAPAAYYSVTNQLNVDFVTDSTMQMRGWQLTWWAAAPLDTTTTVGTTLAASTTSEVSQPTTTTAAPSTMTAGTATPTTAAMQSSSAMQAANETTTTTTTTTATNAGSDPVTTELSGSGANADAQVSTNSSSTVPDWMYLIIAIAIVGVAATVVLSLRLWSKRNRPNKIGDSTAQLQEHDQLQESAEAGGRSHADQDDDEALPSPRRRRGAHIVRDQEVQAVEADAGAVAPRYSRSWSHEKSWATQQQVQKQQQQQQVGSAQPGRLPPLWPHTAHSNDLYAQLDSAYMTSDIGGAAPEAPYADRPPSETDWKLRNVVINPLHPRRQRLYLGEDGQPVASKPTSKRRHHKRAAKKLLAPLQAVAAAATSLGSALSSASQRSSRVGPVTPVAAESLRSIISIPGGGVRPPRPEMVVIGGGRRQPDNPPVQSVT